MEIDIRNTFAKNIISYRKTKSLTQEQLSNSLDVNRCVIGSWEERRSFPKVETLIKISHLLQVSINDILEKDVVWN